MTRGKGATVTFVCSLLIVKAIVTLHRYSSYDEPSKKREMVQHEKQILALDTDVQNKIKREMQTLCKPLPNGSWLCDGAFQGFDNDYLDLISSPQSTPTQPPTLEPTQVILEQSVESPAPSFVPTQVVQQEITESETATIDIFKPSLERDLCRFDWIDDSNCITHLSHEMNRLERSIFAGEYICSTNKDYFFGMTLDFKLAICKGDDIIWSEGPFSGKNPFALFKTDGTLEVQSRKNQSSKDWKILWSSKSGENPQSRLFIDDDATLYIMNKDREHIWSVQPYALFEPHNQETTPVPNIENNVDQITFFPGKLFSHRETGLKLSTGLSARLIARTGSKVNYSNGSKSITSFHDQPDAGGCFPTNDGGWYYLSNSETGNGDTASGGVGRIKFNADGGVEEYKMVLSDTRMNCGSGITPWNTYISCEEYRGNIDDPNKKPGQCWEVHPGEEWPARPTKMGGEHGGRFESAAFDARDMYQLKGFITTDAKNGALHRFSPNPEILMKAIITEHYSGVLHSTGIIDYLELDPTNNSFRWTTNKTLGELSAELYFQNAEGIDVKDEFLYFTSKRQRELFTLNLDTYEFTSSSTSSGAFNGQPDQIVRLVPHNNNGDEDGLLYFLEDGGNKPAGVFARDRSEAKYMTILEGGESHSDESTGLAFCDSGKRMMVAFQDEGTLYEISRDDGKPFYGATVDIKYHSS